MKISYLSVLLISVLILSCERQGIVNQQNHPLTSFKMLEQEEAKKSVITDNKEGFFEKANLLELCVQLQIPMEGLDKSEILEKYKKLLQDDVMAFNSSEKKLLETKFKKALDLCYQFHKNLKLPEIKLIKTRGSYYGTSVYYTRENCIIIPESQLKEENIYLLKTLIHEIFHIYSRYNPEKKDLLYASIGYNKIQNLELSDFLKNRIILNPDGIDIAYAIEVQDSNKRSFKAIPSIYYRFGNYKNIPLLAGFVFQLFEVVENDGKWSVVNKDVGYNEENLSGYWEKIGRNTRYTIHPDEVLADNFTFLMLKNEAKSEYSSLSQEGKALLKKIENILKKD
jgi:hypothetical protein